MHNKVSNAVAIALPVQSLSCTSLMPMTVCTSVLACTNSAVAGGAIDHIRQPELNVSLWADIKKNMVFGCSVLHING